MDIGRRVHEANPFALDPGRESGGALSPAMDVWQVAWPFTAIDQGDEWPFIERWMEWFGLAAQGKLQHPPSIPERPTGSWRR
jgi:serine/threonine-protein kinase